MANSKEYNKAYHRKYQQGFRVKIFNLLGDSCVKCGFSDQRALQVDHVEGGGHKNRDKERAPNQLYKAIVKEPNRFQILCANCNWIKRYERQEYGSRTWQ